VHEILWGYNDKFLDFLKHPLLRCPGKAGLSSFVQLQVCNKLHDYDVASSEFFTVVRNCFFNVWFQKMSIPPPRRELEIPEGWGVKSPGKSRGGGGEWINYFAEGQLRFIRM